MPHDKNGQLVEVGDKVSLELTVSAVYHGADMCNVTLTRAIEGEQSVSLTCQAQQIEIVEKAAPATEAAATEEV